MSIQYVPSVENITTVNGCRAIFGGVELGYGKYYFFMFKI